MGAPATTSAQSTAAPVSGVTFLPRAHFYFLWGSWHTSDPRFSWDGMMGASFDLVGYPRGRLNFSADYEAVLGSELRPFELNHENFHLDASASYRIGHAELAGAFHHVSRHLVDRANPNIVAWNVLDLRARRLFELGRSTLDAELAWGKVLQRTYVDYTWTSDLSLRWRRTLTDRLGWYAAGSGHLVGVDEEKLGRERQCGGRIEAGLHLSGSAAGLELFAGYERRIDGYPLDRTRIRAFTLGFRLLK